MYIHVPSAVIHARVGVRQSFALVARCRRILATTLAIAVISTSLFSQTASTGALAGKILDPSGAFVPGAEVRLTNPNSSEFRLQTSDGAGNFHFLLLPPGKYELEANKTGFAPVRLPDVTVLITETLDLQLHLSLATVKGSAQVSYEAPMVQTNTIAL